MSTGMGGGCQVVVIAMSPIARGHPMVLKYMHAIMAPLMGSPYIIHHGGHYGILNFAAKTFELQFSHRVIPMLLCNGSLVVLYSTE